MTTILTRTQTQTLHTFLVFSIYMDKLIAYFFGFFVYRGGALQHGQTFCDAVLRKCFSMQLAQKRWGLLQLNALTAGLLSCS